MLMPSIFGENLFDDFFNDFVRPARSTVKYNVPAVNVMRTDIKENESGYELGIELPGFKKEDVKVEPVSYTHLTKSPCCNTILPYGLSTGPKIKK